MPNLLGRGHKSPYLKPGRLSDVIAAITTLGTYRYYKLDFRKAAEKIENDPNRANHWREIFENHPEFFRIVDERQKVSLVWRRQFRKNYDPKKMEELTRGEFDLLSLEEKFRLSRRPLSSAELTTLMEIAIKSHDRALEMSKHQKWWVPLAAGILSFLGAIAGSYIRG